MTSEGDQSLDTNCCTSAIKDQMQPNSLIWSQLAEPLHQLLHLTSGVSRRIWTAGVLLLVNVALLDLAKANGLAEVCFQNILYQ